MNLWLKFAKDSFSLREAHEHRYRCNGLVTSICFKTSQVTVGAGRGGSAEATWRK